MNFDVLYLTHPINGVLMIALPVLLGIFLTRKFELGWRLWGIGAFTFVLSQVGHIPFNLVLTRLFERGLLPVPPEDWMFPFNAVVLGLSAGLWEESARFAMYRWWVKDVRSWRKALLLGAGHGGIEAIMLGGLVLYTFIRMAAIRDVDLSTIVPVEQIPLAQQQVSAYWSSPWYMTLLGAVERAFTIPFHIANSIVVLQVFTRRQSRWLWLAIAWHALVNALALYVIQYMGPYAAEAFLGLNALLSIGVIFALRQPEPETPFEPELPLPEPISIGSLPEVEATPENIENTKYN